MDKLKIFSVELSRTKHQNMRSGEEDIDVIFLNEI